LGHLANPGTRAGFSAKEGIWGRLFIKVFDGYGNILLASGPYPAFIGRLADP